MSEFTDLPWPAPPRTELAYEAIVEVGETLRLGQGPLGERRIIPILGGRFEGPNIRGIVLPGGADRQLVRPDGLRLLDAFYEMQTDDGKVLTVRNSARIRDGVAGGLPLYAFSSLVVTAPAGPHEWLNQFVLVGTLRTLRPERNAVLIGVHKLV
ncbi:MAG: DUF3237 domain-containing protein [Comamonas sp.]